MLSYVPFQYHKHGIHQSRIKRGLLEKKGWDDGEFSRKDAKLSKRGIATDGNRWVRIRACCVFLNTKIHNTIAPLLTRPFRHGFGDKCRR